MLAGITTATASLIIALVVLVVAGLTVVWYVIQQRSNEKNDDTDDARTEALALAETRGKRIDDLEADIERLRKSRDEDRNNHDREIQGLRAQILALEERLTDTTRNFAAAQSLTAQAAYDLAITVTEKLEEKPPQVDAALAMLRTYTATPAKPSR